MTQNNNQSGLMSQEEMQELLTNLGALALQHDDRFKAEDAAKEANELDNGIATSLGSFEDQDNLKGAINHIGDLYSKQRLATQNVSPDDITSGFVEGIRGMAKDDKANNADLAKVIYQQALAMGYSPIEAIEKAQEATEEEIPTEEVEVQTEVPVATKELLKQSNRQSMQNKGNAPEAFDPNKANRLSATDQKAYVSYMNRFK